jgi:hypothetical protein
MAGRRTYPVWAAAVLVSVAASGCGSKPPPDGTAAAAVSAPPSDSPTGPSDSPTPTPTDPPSPTASSSPDTAEDASPEDTGAPADDDADPVGTGGSDTAGSDTAGSDGPLGTYDVTIGGTAGGQSFRRTGTVRIVATISRIGTTNGVNPIDVCLVSGMPAADPQPGAIWFGSNSGCNPGANAADIDLGYVEVAGARVTLRPDERIAATLGNHYTVSSGLAACPYAPVSGTLQVDAGPDGSLSGSVDIVGYGGAFCGRTAYRADLTGRAR